KMGLIRHPRYVGTDWSRFTPGRLSAFAPTRRAAGKAKARAALAELNRGLLGRGLSVQLHTRGIVGEPSEPLGCGEAGGTRGLTPAEPLFGGDADIQMFVSDHTNSVPDHPLLAHCLAPWLGSSRT